MNNKQEDRATMGRTTLKLMNENSALWSGVPKIVLIVGDVKSNLINIGAYRMIQETDSRGATKQQEILKNAAAEDSTAVASILKTYFLDQHDETNFKEINFTLSSFNTGTKGQKITKMNRVLNTANGIGVTALSDYGLDPATLPTLKTEILAYELAQGVKKSMTDAASDAGKQIAFNLSEMSKNFKKLDYLVFPIGLTNKSFLNQYRSAREVINRGKGHRTAELEILGGTAVTSFGDNLEPGDAIVVTNYSEDFVNVGLATTENAAPVTKDIKVGPKGKLIVNIPKDAVLTLAKFFSVSNPNANITAKVTIILSKGPSKAKAGQVELGGIPK